MTTQKCVAAGSKAVIRTVLAIALCVGIAVPASAEAEMFVYQRDPPTNPDPDGDLQLWEEGAAPVHLPLSGINPALDPDRIRIAYATNAGIRVADTQGNASQQILALGPTQNHPQPQWWPDGHAVITENNYNIVRVTEAASVWTASTLISWPGVQSNPSVSADGSKIAFLSETTSAGTAVGAAGDKALFVANADGSDPIQLTTPDYNSPSGLFPYSTSFSPSGGAVAVYGYGPSSGSEIFTVNAASGAVTQLTNDGADKYSADWLSDGRIAYATTDETTGASKFRAYTPGFGSADISAEFAPGGYLGPASAPQPTTITAPDYHALLIEYAPQLVFDSQEMFFADSPAEMTDYNGSATADSGNQLYAGSGGTLKAGHASGLPTLGLNYLGATYPDGSPANSDDYLDATQNDATYSLAANSLHADAAYGNQVSGRAIQSGGLLWLQYWLFYYDNPFSPFAPVTATGKHEGDWEMVQIGLDPASHAPQVVAYSQHGGGEWCDWSQVPKGGGPNGIDVPVVYVAGGSHANYTSTGSHGGLVGPVGTDSADGKGPVEFPSVNDITSPPSWVEWGGHWGSSKPTSILGIDAGSESPQGPAFHNGNWNLPGNYKSDFTQCQSSPASPSSTSNSKAPSAPAITSTISGGRAVVDYRLSNLPGSAVGQGLLLTIQGTGAHDTPVGAMTKLTQLTGTRALSLPPVGTAPYVVRASVYSATGARSRVVTSRIEPGR
jgi:hypothetical protein